MLFYKKCLLFPYLFGRRYITLKVAVDICGWIITAHDVNLSIPTGDNTDTHQFRIFPYQLSEITHVFQIPRS